jgi:hypothetical protein
MASESTFSDPSSGESEGSLDRGPESSLVNLSTTLLELQALSIGVD